MASQVQNRIEVVSVFPVPRGRVWAALTEADQLATWFAEGGCSIDLRVGGVMELNFLDGEQCRGIVAGLDPERYFAYRWYPGSGENVSVPLDQQGPLTLVEFTLEDVAEGTRLTVVESGFSALSADRYARAFRENSEGWNEVMADLGAWLASPKEGQ